MTKYTLIKGEDEGTFVTVWEDYQRGRYREFRIPGSWSPPTEDGKTPVEMEIDGEVAVKGTFDPEENSIRGTTELMGEFVFKRDPDFLMFYPPPCALNAQTRWKFAMTSVLGRIRQKAWSSKRILKKLKDGKRFMELTLSTESGNYKPDEREELFSLFPCLYEADTRFFHSLVSLRLLELTLFE